VSETPTAAPAVDRFDELRFTNRFTTDLPADPDDRNHVRQVHGAAFSRVRPTSVVAPRTLAWSPEVAELLGLSTELCASPDLAAVLGGNVVPAGADPYAMCYGGHQFGSWAGQLGDGRAIALGEVTDVTGGHQTLQLKGAGPTPYSRTADGRAVLRSSLREFLCSEAMHHLGVPTTRALSLVATGEPVVRDMLYDGNPRPEPGAIVCRVAPSFVRFGTFQLPAARGDLDLLRSLVEATLAHDFPAITGTFDERVGRLLDEVVDRSARLVAEWMRVGFVHGVLNTDNLSIIGVTIDYGPYGWLEDFDPGWTPNTTDAAGRRYRYGAQPQIVQWNLLQLAQALATAVTDVAPLQAALDTYVDRYQEYFRSRTVERLGWGRAADGDDERIQALFGVLTSSEIDQVCFFRDLARVDVDAAIDLDPDDAGAVTALLRPLDAAWYRPGDVVGDVAAGIGGWLSDWARRVRAGGLAPDERRRRMDRCNPRFVLRNYLAQEAIDAAEGGDLTLLHELHEVLRHPYDEQPGKERFAARRPEWARHRAGCSMLSCSS
jgi:uncharacterized protein YdiU (UPF0061 family)